MFCLMIYAKAVAHRTFLIAFGIDSTNYLDEALSNHCFGIERSVTYFLYIARLHCQFFVGLQRTAAIITLSTYV